MQFLRILSFGSLLLLFMPTTVAGLVGAGVLLLSGAVFILRMKPWPEDFSRPGFAARLLLSAAIAAAESIQFCHRWTPSSKVQAIAAALRIPLRILILLTAAVLAVLSVFAICRILSYIQKDDILKRHWVLSGIVWCVLSAAVTVMLSQAIIGAELFTMGFYKFLLGMLVVFTLTVFLYAWIGRWKLSMVIGSAFFLIISTVSVYSLDFRNRLVEPVDIFALGTAMNVASSYSIFPIKLSILVGWGFFVLFFAFLFTVQSRSAKESAMSAKRRCILLGCFLLGCVSIVFGTKNLKLYHWDDEGAIANGYILDFTAKLKETYVPKPVGYQRSNIYQASELYNGSPDVPESDVRRPHIIVIMDESFSDLNTLVPLSTNQEVIPYVLSLRENAVSGYALASVYGGNTANSEFEFLTGNSMAWISPNAVPYQQYIHSSSYSMVSVLKSEYHYHCVAMHPYLDSGWNRPRVYEDFGFDEMHFLEDFPQENLIRGFVTDQEMFEAVINTFEHRGDDPLFLFGVTMQNHGNYTDEEDLAPTIRLEGYENEHPDAEQYLTLIHETDAAVEYLISYFSQVDEDVVIVFFGDHQPTLGDSFYEDIGIGDPDSLDALQQLYKVPFFVWANYDIEEQSVECTSLNYLSTYVYEVAGLTLPPYNSFLSDMEAEIPSINSNGFYSVASGCYLPPENASPEERIWLKSYQNMQYNNLFDRNYRDSDLFPVLEDVPAGK